MGYFGDFVVESFTFFGHHPAAMIEKMCKNCCCVVICLNFWTIRI